MKKIILSAFLLAGMFSQAQELVKLYPGKSRSRLQCHRSIVAF